MADSHKLAVYTQRGGCQGFKKALTMAAGGPGRRGEEVEPARPRRRRLPDGDEVVVHPQGRQAVYLVVNADESEPGTCKDRELLAYDPHLLIEGMMIASYALGCKHAYIYIRGEMMREAKIVQAAIDEAYAAGWLGKDHTGARRRRSSWTSRSTGARARTSAARRRALLNSLEGKRGWPRLKPPFPAVKGLFRRRRSSTTSRR